MKGKIKELAEKTKAKLEQFKDDRSSQRDILWDFYANVTALIEEE